MMMQEKRLLQSSLPNGKGIIESKLVGSLAFEKSGIDVSYVISSPSCRARETAIRF